MKATAKLMGQQRIFVEIGAADFDTLLPLARNGWRGYIIEPVQDFVTSLQETIDAEGLDVKVMRLAVTTHSGQTQFLESLERDIQWQKGISHLANQRGTQLLNLKMNENIPRREITIPCLRLDHLLWDTLCLQHSPTGIDFLKMDIEGHEREVLEDYSWNILPKLMKIEHKHCNDMAMSELLEKRGYHVWTERDDLYAML